MLKFLKQKNPNTRAKLSMGQVKKKKGFTLIEVLVAILILSMTITGMMSVLSRGLVNINYARNKITATYLAQEGIEYILHNTNAYRVQQDWPTYVSPYGDIDNCKGLYGCYTNLSIGEVSPINSLNDSRLFYSSLDGYNNPYYSNNSIDSGFRRTIKITPINDNGNVDEINVTSTVFWNNPTLSDLSNTCASPYCVSFSDHFFNWMQ